MVHSLGGAVVRKNWPQMTACGRAEIVTIQDACLRESAGSHLQTIILWRQEVMLPIYGVVRTLVRIIIVENTVSLSAFWSPLPPTLSSLFSSSVQLTLSFRVSKSTQPAPEIFLSL